MLKYFISREFFLTLLGLVGLGVIIYLLIFFMILPGYTRHGKTVLVPDVSRMSVEEAGEALDDAGLRFETKDSIFQEGFPPHAVTDQYPVPLSRVKPDRKVFLTVNKATAPMVKLPKVTDMNLYQAKSRLKSWKLDVGKVIYKPDAIATRDEVLDMEYNGKIVKKGVEVPQGSRIDLIISEGKSERKVPLPDLTGLTLDDALSELRSVDLNLGVPIYKSDGPPGNDGRIYSQNPRARYGDSVNAGFSIDVYIYGQEPSSIEGVDVEDDND